MGELHVVTTGLRFPEGPIAMADGSVILVEMFGPRVTRVLPDGTKETVAEVPGGPNGAAIGPDGALYLCNNGGSFTPVDLGDLLLPGPFDPQRYLGGRIQRIDLASGVVTDLYTECHGRPLRAPNDLVFDSHGGFWFTDHGVRDDRTSDRTGIFYAQADGSGIREVIHPTDGPNGIGLSPDGATLYYAETHTGRVYRRSVVAPGEVAGAMPLDTSICLAGLPGLALLDSLAVDGDGNVCVATLVSGGITVISPEGDIVDFVATGDLLTTNICFGGPDLRTAYITLSGTGQLVSTEWPRPGLRLAH
ncbi:MAG: SMP-30/gluconolactonase/LRE family protein [Acidimicrobiales bacterium]|nr:SMP-30/gluconolactonase/LRE family protein [Acidimicrobiales bacterium]